LPARNFAGPAAGPAHGRSKNHRSDSPLVADHKIRDGRLGKVDDFKRIILWLPAGTSRKNSPFHWMNSSETSARRGP
jgi:hypothetical protein